MNTKKQRNIFAFNIAEEANKKELATENQRSPWEADKQVLAARCTDTIWGWGMPAYSDGDVFC